MKNSIYSILVPRGGCCPTHTVCSKEFKNIESDIINSLYSSLDNILYSSEFIGCWLYDKVELDSKEWIRSGISLLAGIFSHQHFHNFKGVQDIFYDVYSILANYHSCLPDFKLNKGGLVMYNRPPKVNNICNPRYCNYKATKAIPLVSHSVTLELIGSGKDLINKNSIVKKIKKPLSNLLNIR